ncbi:hypothetical protein C5S30_02735 [ANME-1 cluster archaeon GoMg4]|nr:hypothetical protein [ANME-1 cluster archaeon GoMg4]
MKTKTIRLKEKFADELERIVGMEGKTESETIREIFDFGLMEYKIRKAIEKYQRGIFSQGGAAEFAGLTIQEFHREIKKRGFVLRIDKGRLEQEMQSVMPKFVL